MSDSSSFTSLLALVDNHLSKCSVQENNENDSQFPFRPFNIPSLHNGQKTTVSDTLLAMSAQKLPIPTVSASDSPIADVLAVQLSNMFKAKELKRQQEEEELRVQEKMKQLKLEEDNCVIDLMHAIQTPYVHPPRSIPNEEVLSSSSSLESLLFDNKKFYMKSDLPSKHSSIEPLLPCITDMSYILHHKIKRGKCSSFGKVLTARVRPVAAPYLREKIDSDIVRFDFSTKSPCDLIKEKLRKPTCHIPFNPMEFITNFLADTEPDQ